MPPSRRRADHLHGGGVAVAVGVVQRAHGDVPGFDGLAGEVETIERAVLGGGIARRKLEIGSFQSLETPCALFSNLWKARKPEIRGRASDQRPEISDQPDF
jgi:hypothetical protein